MIHGYMPYGNIDEDLYVRKGRQPIQGYAIGILCPDTLWMPLPPGCPQNASTYDFPVLLKVVEEPMTFEILSAKAKAEGQHQLFPRLRDAVIKAAKELENQGVRAISGAIGFFVVFQKEVSAAVDIPVFLTSLCQIPLIRQGLKPGQKIGVMALTPSASDFFSTEVFEQVDVHNASDLIIIGCRESGEASKMRGTHNVGHFNPSKVEQELVDVARQMVKDNPEIGAILLECSVMSPYAWAIQNAVELPVYDFYTQIDWIYKSVVRRPFAGFF